MAGITHLEELQKPALRGLIDESIELREQTPTSARASYRTKILLVQHLLMILLKATNT